MKARFRDRKLRRDVRVAEAVEPPRLRELLRDIEDFFGGRRVSDSERQAFFLL
jgi:hypothetical protein